MNLGAPVLGDNIYFAQQLRPAHAEGDADNDNGAALRNRVALFQVSIVSPVIQTAMMVLSRGRFADKNEIGSASSSIVICGGF
ncbi:hypothetical protein Plhal304r1_c020g0073031 [Plasmopara halstedii]